MAKFSNTQKIKELLDGFNDEMSKTNCADLTEIRNIQDNYAKAIELTVKDGCGIVMPIDMFVELVEEGYISDNDGSGHLLNNNGENSGALKCDIEFLQNSKTTGSCFVAWYNK